MFPLKLATGNEIMCHMKQELSHDFKIKCASLDSLISHKPKISAKIDPKVINMKKKLTKDDIKT